MENKDRITNIIRLIQENKASEAELMELMELLKQDKSGDLVDLLAAHNETVPIEWHYDMEKWDRLATDILSADKQPIAPNKKGKVVTFSWWKAAAAVILLVLGVSSYFLIFDKRIEKDLSFAQQPLPNDAAPGGDRAILTLADGRQIVLDSTQGTVNAGGGVRILNLQGQLRYSDKEGEDQNAALAYNTISTPKGGQYQLILSDGTKVWLNAASSMRFPVVFQGTERKVEVTGEAYFEVAHNPSLPFIVKRYDTEVSVLGTHFNVDAYNDEATLKVTLLEGKVRVGHAGAKVLLYPGQQAQIANGQGAGIRVAKEVDLEEVIAWKNGEFQFGDAAEIDDALRQLARWYDVEFEFKDNISGHIGGTISRNVPLSQVLSMLEMTGMVGFTIEGKKVEVKAK